MHFNIGVEYFNITYWDGANLIRFDTVQVTIDHYVRSISDKYFDKDGYLASKV